MRQGDDNAVTDATAPGQDDKTDGPAGPLLSVIVPAYNEEQRIPSTIATISCYLDEAGIDYEVIVVSDGSTDGTAEVTQRLVDRYPRLRLVAYQPNHGKGYAVRTGVAAARGTYVMFTDADLTVPITIVDDFLTALQDGYDIAVASRRHPASHVESPPPPLRRAMGEIFNWFVRHLIVSTPRDTQCGSKGYRAEVARRLFARQRIDHFSFDAEVIYLAVHDGYRIKEVPATLRYVPTTTIRPMHDSLVMLRDLVRIRLNALRGAYDR